MNAPLTTAPARPSRRGGSPLRSSSSLMAMLDSLRANVFAADLAFNLVYMNRTARDTVRRLEPALRESFGVGLAEMLGGSIHRFHQDPARVESLLRDPSNFPHRATFAFRGIVLSTQINAIADDRGTIHGYIV